MNENENSLDKGTQIDEVWRKIRTMNGRRREYGYPVLDNRSETAAITDEEKAEMPVQSFAKFHSTNNISVEE